MTETQEIVTNPEAEQEVKAEVYTVLALLSVSVSSNQLHSQLCLSFRGSAGSSSNLESLDPVRNTMTSLRIAEEFV